LTRSVALLAIGAAVGLVAAAAGLVSAPRRADELPGDAVATVNGTEVRRADYERAVTALASDRRSALDDADKRHVLDRLVDEELLVQRAFELGLAQRDRRVRTDLVTAVIEAVTNEADQHEPSDADVARFFAENGDYFALPGRMQVEQVFVRASGESDPDALARARDAAARLRAGAGADAVQGEVGGAPVAPLPGGLLPAAKLREYLGPAAIDALRDLAPNGVTDPVRAAGGYHVLRLVAREPGATPELAAVRDEVRAELRRRGGDEALRRYLDELRRRAEIRVAGALP
jgi:parvulin-like peptidyl-prolyl isomerase